MTPQITETLMWHGITPPSEGRHRTTCPHCSHTRRKTGEKCLVVRDRDTYVEWYCYHCGWEHGEWLQ